MSKARLLGYQRTKEQSRAAKFRPGRCPRCGAKLQTGYRSYSDGTTVCRCGGKKRIATAVKRTASQ